MAGRDRRRLDAGRQTHLLHLALFLPSQRSIGHHRCKNHLEVVPLSQASQGVFDDKGETLFFTRLPFQGSEAKRYKGGTAQNLWKYVPGQEATPLTSDYSGISKNAMYWKGRVYFASDRDGTMNLWSMNEDGKDLKQLTRHQGWDIHDPSLGGGRSGVSTGRQPARLRHRIRHRQRDPDRIAIRFRSSARALD